jgi:hypothetical protein
MNSSSVRDLNTTARLLRGHLVKPLDQVSVHVSRRPILDWTHTGRFHLLGCCLGSRLLSIPESAEERAHAILRRRKADLLFLFWAGF